MIRPSKPIASAAFATTVLACLITTGVLAQQPATPDNAPATPRQDLLTIEGCLSGDTLTITKDDHANLTHARTLKLTGTRAMRQRVREARNQHVEVTGALVVSRGKTPPDRLEGRAKRKVGDKTTIYVATASEQARGVSAPETDASYDLDVVSLRVLAPQCLGAGS